MFVEEKDPFDPKMLVTIRVQLVIGGNRFVEVRT